MRILTSIILLHFLSTFVEGRKLGPLGLDFFPGSPLREKRLGTPSGAAEAPEEENQEMPSSNLRGSQGSNSEKSSQEESVSSESGEESTASESSESDEVGSTSSESIESESGSDSIESENGSDSIESESESDSTE